MQNRYCGGCGYDLMGIASRGVCPECGRWYNVETGQGTDARQSPWYEQYFKTIVLLVSALVVLACSGLLSLVSSRPKGLLLGGAAIAGVVLLAGLYHYVSERQDAKAEDDADA